MFNCAMRQVEERHVTYQVDLMVWSNRLDLVAISNFKGEVQVHRLHWQKVWNLPAPKENVTVQAIAWRPDGKALAIGYSFGIVYVVDIEDKEILDKYDFSAENSEDPYDCKPVGISCITWAVKAGVLESATEYNVYDDATIFLQKPPSASTSYKSQGSDDTVQCYKEIPVPSQLSMLMIGYGNGNIYMSVFGRYPYGTIQLAELVNDECGEYKLLDINLSNDFSVTQVLYLDKITKNIYLSVINTSVLSAYSEELFVVANKHCQIVQLLSHLDQTMTSITEAWEHILLEMDSKMAHYASSVPKGGVSADLLELLMLGVPSDELELFLLQELTAKGLKKFGSSVELSYSTIQKLVLKQLNIVGHNLSYYLSDIRGLTRIPDRFKILGLDETTVTRSIRACCAFLNKCLELQQVIDVSMRNYKAFFRWLFVVIIRLLDEQTPCEIVKMTQQEFTHIAELLYNFDSVQTEGEHSSEKPVKFNLERLGQYLQDQDLTILPDDEDNPWHKFLKDNSCLVNDSDTIFSMTEFRRFSLVQQQKYLKDAINQVFDVTGKNIGKHFSVIYNTKCYENRGIVLNPERNLRISQTYDSNQDRFVMGLVDLRNAPDRLCLMSIQIKEKSCSAVATKYYFSSNLLQQAGQSRLEDETMEILDLQFYSADYLSILVRHPRNEENSIFIQLPVKVALENASDLNIKSKTCVFNEKTQEKNISSYLDQSVYKILEKMDGFRIAVSGGRKVSVVLSKSHRKVRVFEMEVNGDDEEDETLDTTPQSQSSHAGEQQTPKKHDASTEDFN
ncbi:PREDICTED: anaphase-promoting complex subunit 4 [Papilio xuthus]|uniref:Anaphase-promoting complex subunit 4 n=1 Tax=Papilio xuthus TaxID=66420 RepID=A0AAJ6ZLW4_PAPXU|nr:PREDICTED: anaphase-promoting complex subunit 4 [Papilio xuthus]